MHKDTYVIIPVFNEETVVKQVIDEVSKYFSHVICVNDCSTDDSLRELKKTSAIILQHDTNKGQGAALKTGIDYALSRKGAKYIMTFDADGQHDVQDAVGMVDVIRKNKELDIVLGSRFLGSAKGMSFSRRILLKLAVQFTNITTGIKLTDTHNGLRVFNRRFASGLRLRCSGMAHASEFIVKIADKGYRYQEHPVTISYTDYSKMKGQPNLNALTIIKELYFTKN